MVSSVLSPLSQAKFGPNGTCGEQHGGALCDPEKGGICCSINGFCGDTDEYCLISSGCQSNCTDGTPTATVTVSTPSATETTKASSSGGITGDRLIILIIGCVVGVFVIAAVCFMIRSWWKHKERMEETRAAQHNPFASVGERRAFELGLYMSGQTALPAQPGRAAIMPAIVNQHSPYGNGAIDNSRHVHDIGSDDGND